MPCERKHFQHDKAEHNSGTHLSDNPGITPVFGKAYRQYVFDNHPQQAVDDPLILWCATPYPRSGLPWFGGFGISAGRPEQPCVAGTGSDEQALPALMVVQYG
ncbi:hypothetical protein MXD60_03475 [Frankia sp. AgB32]|nr:hypothetical protein [Frankia sp. AgB32]